MKRAPVIAITSTVAAGGALVTALTFSRVWAAVVVLVCAAAMCGLLAMARDDLADEGDTMDGVITPRRNRQFGWASAVAAIGAVSLVWWALQQP